MRITANEINEKLRKASVGLAGLGGLGSHIAAALVRVGIGTLKGVDFDIVDLSNIGRQYYFTDQIGMHKTGALKSTLKRISTLTKLDLINLKINADNAKGLFDGCSVIIEAFDDPHTKAMFFDSCRIHYKEQFYIGASGVAGYGYTEMIKIKKMGKNVFIVGDFTSEPEQMLELTASKVGIIANMQANLAIHLIVEGDFDNC